MGKIVKHCSNCDENFAEKFSFCPNCASALSAFEMQPVPSAPVKAVEPAGNGSSEIHRTAGTGYIAEPVKNVPTQVKSEFTNESAAQPIRPNPQNRDENVREKTEFPKPAETKSVEVKPLAESNPPIKESAPVNVAPTSVDDYSRTYEKQKLQTKSEPRKAVYAETVPPVTTVPVGNYYDDRGGYNITFVEEKDGGKRNMLLLGAFTIVSFLAISGLIYSLYNNDAMVGALIDEDAITAIPLVDAPEEIKPEEPPKPKTNTKAGGGGGGGKEEPLPTSKGVLAPQMKNPVIPPSAKMPKLTNPEIKIQPATEGTANIKRSNEPYGNPNSLSTVPSDGTGRGGGMGEGTGRGQGNGRGTGAGNGVGSGLGNGIGDGVGDGRGSGVEGRGAPPALVKPKPEPPPAGPTVALNITSKPRANYTDAARQNQVQGTVTLRVTFLASGAIGSISPVNGLPNGLTEQAIAAARQIRFEPAKKAGVPYTVTKQVQYNFTLY